MSTLRRSAVLGAVVAALSVGLVTPAYAGHTVTVTITGPGEAVATSTFPVTAELRTSDDTTWTGEAVLEVKQVGSDRGPLVVKAAPARQVSFPVRLDHNGKYEAKVTATSHDPGVFGVGAHNTSNSAKREFLVAAPPAPPRDVKATVDPATRTVTLTWKANAEPDLIGYVVQRAKGDGPFADLGPVSKTANPTYRDVGTAEAGGVYRYQVVAVRSDGITENKGISSDPSAVTPEATATVPDPPAPPSATPGTTVVANSSGAPPATTGTTGAPANNPGALTTSGSVDLSGFRSLQSQARATSPRTTRPVDSGFRSTLPFATTQPQEEGELVEEGGELGEVAADSPQFRELGAEDDEGRRQESLAFLAAGLLATVLLMHVLWIKSEVKRAPLEPLTPE